jgi:uncharacterized protein
MNEFQLLIKPTSFDCNLDCDYCFYKRVNSIYDEKNPRMSTQVLEKLIQIYLGYRFENSVFCWQGGEPTLMGLEFFEKVIELQKKYGKGGQAVGNILQTNGILLNDEWANFLKRYNFFVGISLDGPKSIHNIYRKTKNDRGTWDQVMRVIEVLKNYEIEFNILCVVSKANVNMAKELYNFYKENNLKFLQFIPALECTKNKKMAPFSPKAEEYGNFLCEIFDLWKKKDSESVYIRMFNQVLSMYLGATETSCPFDKTCYSYFVVEWNGDIYPCDFFVKPKMKLGNLMNEKDFKPFFEKKNEIFSKYKKELSKDCYICHWKNICYGGCLKDRFFCENPDKNKSYYCNSYKKFFTHSYDWFSKRAIQIQKIKRIPYYSAVKKINRNDFCPCGSGLKYKKCHGKN